MEQPKPEKSLWPFFAAFTVSVIMVAAVRWSFAHPYGIHWDEAEYLNWVAVDLQRLYSGMLLRLGGRILISSQGMPPAYRVLALPFLIPFGFHTTAARLASLAEFVLSCWFIYLASRRVGTQVAGAFAVLVFALSPEVVSASMFFGTDAPLYLATSAMLYYLFVYWGDPSERSSTWIGLGLAIGLGFWSKASFFAIAPPVLAFALIVSLGKHRSIARVLSLCKACALGGLIGAPWWLVNVRQAMAYARYSRGFVRNSLGSPSLATWARWLDSVVQCLLGHAVSILIASIAIVFLWKVIVKRERMLDDLRKKVVGACACAALPIVLVQLSGTNHLLRHISPAVVPLAITVGVVADQIGWTRSKVLLASSGILFFAQLAMIVYPVVFPNKSAVDPGFVNGSPPWRVMIRFDQWDWKPLRDISVSCGDADPTISYLGGGRAFDPPHMQSPWIGAGASTNTFASQVPYPTWLWRYENGPINWQEVMDGAEKSDIVVTAPGYVGEESNKEDLDNQHNTEFADRLSHDPLFQGPIRLTMGRFAPIDVVVFVKSTLRCRAGKDAQFGGKDPWGPTFESGIAKRSF
ncbi:MAG: glycosyltransferase family 39 protein [Candidatus Acidiferrales bacterium]